MGFEGTMKNDEMQERIASELARREEVIRIWSRLASGQGNCELIVSFPEQIGRESCDVSQSMPESDATSPHGSPRNP
jgi:hypothetical protein